MGLCGRGEFNPKRSAHHIRHRMFLGETLKVASSNSYTSPIGLFSVGYQPDDGPCFEVYPEEPKEGEKIKVDICVPVKPM